MKIKMSEVPLVRDVFAIYLSKESVLRSWSDATLRCYGAAGRMLLTFNPSLRIDGLGRREMEELYLSFARGELSNRSIKYYFTLLSTFLRWAEREGYPVDGSWKDFKPRLKQAPKAVVWLNPDELGALMRLPRRGWTAAKRAVADYFLLSCFTGLRASDLKRLRWCDVRDGSIRIVTSKTAASITVELNRFSREIIGRQKGRDGESGFLMPRADLAAANGVLKQIALEAGLTAPVASVTYRSGGKRIERVHPKWQEISMHCGRRTFICNALALGISPLVVMRWTGHKNFASLKPYIDISDAEKATAMARFDSL